MNNKGESRNELAYLFHERDLLTERISVQIQEVLQEEYGESSNEVKETILRINEKIIANLKL